MMKIQSEVVPQVEFILNYNFMKPDICWEALQGKGAGGFPHGNKRLALVGDVLLRLKHIRDWFPTSSSPEVGTNIASGLGTNAHLAMRGRQAGLDRFINPNPSQKGAVNDGLVADTVEALIGAVEMDGGSWALDEVMKRLGVL
ncbi:hypothetical protein LSUE1_G007417 [Lachnellula suecica]|uniref:RNase III domain-containing protein n=1 Tax=Lachnellula suecica TaxID=602035 RepID=A0A8T9C1Z3_9HELO|nr:hypothetical protein LSUE1_G007417 [Lachnellula suecica]